MRYLAILLVCASLPLPAAYREPVRARSAMVVSTETNATQVGLDVLKRGGNAVDAAVAVGFALAATYPAAGNIGGGGFMLIRFADGRHAFIDFRETAPAAASRDMYLGPGGEPTGDSVTGYRASGVPGTARGLELAHRKYGSRPWPELVESAAELAARGFRLTWGEARSLRSSSRLENFAESRRIFQRNGRYYQMGELLRQPELGAVLSRIAANGADEFYTGRTARSIAEDMRRNGGLITLEDLRDYKPVEREPLTGEYRGHEIITAPPPSSGGAGILQMLAMLEGTGYHQAGAGSALAIHHASEAMRRFFADRAEYFADRDFAEFPLEKLISREYARERFASFDPERAGSSERIGPGLGPWEESAETTHYSIVDAQGAAAAVTYTLNGSYGSGVTIAGTGILMNNEMDDFTAKPGAPNMFGVLQSAANAIEPRKRPLSSMAPTIVTRAGKLHMVTGTPGGPTIISTVLQTILNVVDFGMNAQEAADFPRFHHQWMPDELRLEGVGFSPDTIRLLEAKGHSVKLGGPMGRAMLIVAEAEGLTGAADARSEGLAAGY